MVESLQSAPPERRRMIPALGVAFLCAASLAGTAVGVVPTLNSLVLGAIGRAPSETSAPPDIVSVCLLFVFQILLFAAIFVARSRHAANKRVTSAAMISFGIVLVAAWLPVRGVNLVYLKRDQSVVIGDNDGAREVKLATTAGERAWKQRANRDEARDLSVILAIHEGGGRQFLDLGRDDLDGCVDAARRQHPPLAYLMMSLFPFRPGLLRFFCLGLYVLGVLLIVIWCCRELDNDAAQAALLLFASAVGMAQELALRVNLDVFVFALGGLLAYFSAPLLRTSAPNDVRGSAIFNPWVAVCSLLSVMTLFKFTGLVTAISLAASLIPRWKLRALVVAVIPIGVFISYHFAVAMWGVPFSSTYLGDLLFSYAGEQDREFEGGGLVKSLVTLVAFILSPLGALCWFGGLAWACWRLFTPRRPWKEDVRVPITLLAVGNTAIVYVIHPLLRYVSPGLWAVAGAATGAFTTRTRHRFWLNGLLSAAAAYGLTKLVADAYF